MLACKKIIAAMLCGLFTAAHIVAVSGLIGAPDAFERSEYQGGWEELDIPAAEGIVQSVPEWNGVGEGQTRLLYKDYEKVHGRPYKPRNQGRTPSCVGQATAAAVDFLAAVEIRAGEPERTPPAPAAACVIYGLSRIEIGQLDNTAMGGSHNLWAAQAIQKYGVVARLDYALLGYDLREPSLERCIEFGTTGVPTGLEVIARLHPVRDYVAIDTYAECRDALYMGSPVIVGSSVGFGGGKLTRDRDGFLVPPRRRLWRSVWNHSMTLIGVRDSGRKGCLCLNSWGGEGAGGWINGPKTFPDQPDGCFMIDWEIVERMVKQGDSFALRSFSGYPSYRLWRPSR